MNFPQWWILKRPGTTIPVFFLSLLPVQGQFSGKACGVAALGSTFVARSGECMAMHNQAGLGGFGGKSLSLQHSRPWMCPDLGISLISAQLATSGGAIGATLSHYGIDGLSFTSLWVAYGLQVQKHWSAGLGIHFWNSSISERWMYHPCFSFAAGIQAHISDNVILAAHVAHPAGWYSKGSQPGEHPMTISVGGSWAMAPETDSYLELEFCSGRPFRWKTGIEWRAKRGIGLQIGFHSQPFTFSCGTSLDLRKWNIQTAFTYCPDAGHTPYSALTYDW
jgi:hypothetical protein